MRRVMWGLFIALVGLAAPVGRADDLTESLLGIDPRSRLQTGTGAVYGDVYGPEEDEQPSPLSDTESEEAPNEAFLGEYAGLRSALVAPSERPASRDELPSTLDHSTLDRLLESPTQPPR